MSLDGHLAALSDKHDTLERQIEKEEHRPSPDETRLKSLKREKLRIRDEMESLRRTAA